MTRFPVLMYHRIASDRLPVDDTRERPWAVSLTEFTWQMGRLAELGAVGVAMGRIHGELEKGRTIPREWVGITFDDGNASDHAHALGILSERGFTATFFVTGSRIGAPGGLGADAIRELAAAGMHVGSHAMTHRFLTTLPAAEETDELARSRDLLAGIVGAPVDHFAPPGGRWSRRTAATLRALSYCAVSTSAFGYNDATRPRFAYRRIPVTAATSRARFDAILARGRWPLAGAYLRAGALAAARGVVGESIYRHARSLRGGG